MAPSTLPRWLLLITPLVSALLATLVGTALALSPVAASAATVTGSGQTVTETRSVAEFQAIALSASMDLSVRQGASQSLQVQADDNLLPLLETVVENNSRGATLVVRWKSGQSIYHRSKVKLTVVMPKLTDLSVSGSGDALVQSFSTPSLQVAVTGSGDVRLPGLSTDDFGVRISGSGDVSADGKAVKLKVRIAGSGDVRFKDLVADDVAITIAGSGDAAVNAQKTLDVSIAGSGDVVYSGNATVKKSVAGSGSVKQR